MILTLVEHEGDRPSDLSLQALALGRRLAGDLGVEQHACMVGEDARAAAGALGSGVAAVHVAVHEGLDAYAPMAWGRCLAQAVRELVPAAVVAAASDRGAEVMAHAAALLEAPLAANCTGVEPSADGGAWTLTRQRWGGSLLERARISGPVRLLTVAPHAVRAEDPAGDEPPEIRAFKPELEERDHAVRVVDRVEPERRGVSLAEARVVVGGGRGVGGAEGFAALEELARLLGGAVGCSRVVTSNGWRPHADQIGQTGTRIAPDLYVACGISGATQHIVGCRGAKRILAINTDAEAPILSHADYAIVGDLREVVPAISAEIRRAIGG